MRGDSPALLVDAAGLGKCGRLGGPGGAPHLEPGSDFEETQTRVRADDKNPAAWSAPIGTSSAACPNPRKPGSNS